MGVEAIERAVGTVLHGVHRSRDEAAALIDLAVIYAIGRFVGFGISDELCVSSREIEEMKAIGERQNRATLLAQRHRTYFVWHVPRADLATVGGASEHVTTETIDEIEPLLLNVP